MTVTFRTQPYPWLGSAGQPDRARGCRCDKPVIDHDDGCVRCGQWTADAIADTWFRQARVMALPFRYQQYRRKVVRGMSL